MKTSIEHAALSAELARALGWKAEIVEGEVVPGLTVHVRSRGVRWWRVFDYRSPDVCLPLIVWLYTEHNVTITHSFLGFCVTKGRSGDIANTLPEAVARAVIAVKGKS